MFVFFRYIYAVPFIHTAQDSKIIGDDVFNNSRTTIMIYGRQCPNCKTDGA